MTYDVRFTGEAERCVRQIRDWLAERSAEGALRWLDALESARGQLARRALAYGLAPEADQFSEPLRQVLFKTQSGNVYRAIFVVRNTVVHVVSVRGAGQAPLETIDIVIPE